MQKGNALVSLGFVFLLASGIAQAQVTYRLTYPGTLGGTARASSGSAINASGHMTGSSPLPGDTSTHAYIWKGASLLDLGTLGGTISGGNAINSAGQVTGYSTLAGDSSNHAILWNGVSLLDLGSLGGSQSEGVAINDAGQVTGYSMLLGDSAAHAFLWNGATMIDLGTLGGASSWGAAINSAGQITGYADLADTSSHAFLWDGATMVDLGTLGGTGSSGVAINPSGQVAGTSTIAGDERGHAFLWNGTTIVDLGTLGGSLSESTAINASGQVTGYSYTPGDVTLHAFLWTGTTMVDLGSLGGAISGGTSINSHGQVTGYARIPGSSINHAFLSNNGAPMQDLNDLIDPSDPLKPHVTLRVGRSINDSGQILADGCDNRLPNDSGCGGYLVSPIVASPAVTPAGNGVEIEPVVTLPDGSVVTGVQLIFDSVVASGTTTVTAWDVPIDGAPESPPTFSVGDPPIYYDVETTASFAGLVTLCFPWQEGQFDNENGIALFHFEQGVWQNVTTTIDVGTNTVCGNVSSLSPFALFEGSSFSFSGFYPPVDNPPTRNIAKAGSAIPVKFSLGGDKGLNIFYPGYPVAQMLTCNAGVPSDVVETVATSPAGLTYDAASGQYSYVWKSDKSWGKSCRRLIVRLSDGSIHVADFEFAK